MKYQVRTRVVINRIYIVEAADEKAAISESTFSIPVDEIDLEEETLSVQPHETDG